jgi:hypothetical protein
MRKNIKDKEEEFEISLGFLKVRGRNPTVITLVIVIASLICLILLAG